MVWDIPALTDSDADGSASLAEAVAGNRINEQALVVPVIDAAERLTQLREKTVNAAMADGMGPWFVRWFLADRWERSISPLSGVTVQDYIKRRIAEGRIAEVAVLFPGHPLLTATAKESLVRRKACTNKRPTPIIRIPKGMCQVQLRPTFTLRKEITRIHRQLMELLPRCLYRLHLLPRRSRLNHRKQARTRPTRIQPGQSRRLRRLIKRLKRRITCTPRPNRIRTQQFIRRTLQKPIQCNPGPQIHRSRRRILKPPNLPTKQPGILIPKRRLTPKKRTRAQVLVTLNGASINDKKAYSA